MPRSRGAGLRWSKRAFERSWTPFDLKTLGRWNYGYDDAGCDEMSRDAEAAGESHLLRPRRGVKVREVS